MNNEIEDWFIFKGNGEKNENFTLPDPPSWRQFTPEDVNPRLNRGKNFIPPKGSLRLINAALYLRRPLLVTGKPGTGKTSLAYAVAEELGLKLLRWNIGTRTTLKDGLYRYDAIARAQDGKGIESIGEYIQLGPLGSALSPDTLETPTKLNVLLVDEIDKSDIDLPNDLLHVLEEGRFDIPELKRAKELVNKDVTVTTALNKEVKVINGEIICKQFPFVVMTSNGERDFPPAFLRRCLRLKMEEPELENLRQIVASYLGDEIQMKYDWIIRKFIEQRNSKFLATDQLLNAVHLISEGNIDGSKNRDELAEQILEPILKPLDKS